jgi:hypothetical protein
MAVPFHLTFSIRKAAIGYNDIAVSASHAAIRRLVRAILCVILSEAKNLRWPVRHLSSRDSPLRSE